jgi:hypothetical protein
MLHGFPVKIVRTNKGEAGIADTLKLMRELANDGAHSWEVRYSAAQIVGNAPERDQYAEAKAIFDFTQHYNTYRHDPDRIELLHDPRVTLALIREDGAAANDCDDYTILAASMLKTIGYRVKLRAVALKPSTQFSHVYLLVNVYGRWVPFDAIRKDVKFGWESPRVGRTMDLEV